MAEFDKYAADYKEILDRSVLDSDGSEYFYEHKAGYIRRLLGAGEFRGKILDFGCGPGLLSAHLRETLPSATLHGFDPAAESLKAVPSEVRAGGVYTSTKDELHSDYDLITVINVLHHVPVAERQELVDDLARRLVPGGKLLVVEHNPLNPATRWVVAHCVFDEDAILLWRREVLALLSKAGLKRSRSEYVLFFPRLFGWLQPVERLLGWLPMGAQFAAVFERPRS